MNTYVKETIFSILLQIAKLKVSIIKDFFLSNKTGNGVSSTNWFPIYFLYFTQLITQ